MRYERKYKLENVGRSVVEQIIRLHPEGFRELYPPRRVNNIYFDTPDFRCFLDNVAGIAERKKFRVRWYGIGSTRILKPVLEIKIKQNQLGFKQSFNLDAFDGQQIPLLTTSVNQHLNGLHHLNPVLLNAYDRAYLSTPDQKFRITIDYNLQFGFVGPQLQHFSYRDEETVIVELKYDAPVEQEVDRITQYLPFRVTKSSKYVYGVGLLYG